MLFLIDAMIFVRFWSRLFAHIGPKCALWVYAAVIVYVGNSLLAASAEVFQKIPEAKARLLFDVVVVGGDPEGVAAAVASARAGAKTILLDVRNRLGGLWTRGWLNVLDMNLDRSGKPLNGGIFGELFRRLDGTSFDVSAMERYLREMVAATPNLVLATAAVSVRPVISGKSLPLYRPGQTLWPEELACCISRALKSTKQAAGLGLTSLELSSSAIQVLENWVTASAPLGVDLNEPLTIEAVEAVDAKGRLLEIRGKMFIDATQDADLAVAAGACFVNYGEDVWGEQRNMAATLVFKLDGIEQEGWRRIQSDLRRQSLSSHGLVGATDRSAWGFGEILRRYIPHSPRIRIRALNLGRQDDGTLLVNALQIFGVDGLDPQSRLQARAEAIAELPRLIDFLRSCGITGFETAKLAGTAPELYIRTTRQIETLYKLSVDDVLENRDCDDRVAFGSYPLDVQATDPSFPGDVIGKPVCYAIPLRSLIPKGFSNLFVVGRSAGFDSLAQSSARTIPVGITAGQGAGVAAVVALRKGLSVDRLPYDKDTISQIHSELAQQGVKIASSLARAGPETSHWAYEGLKFMRRYGQASGGYDNNYQLDAPMPVKAFTNRLLFLGRDFDVVTRRYLDALGSTTSTIPLTLGNACSILYWVTFDHEKSKRLPSVSSTSIAKGSYEKAIKAFYEAGLFSTPWPENFLDCNKILTRGAGYLLLARWWQFYKKSRKETSKTSN